MNMLLVLLLSLFLGAPSINTVQEETEEQPMEIYFFVAETCPICQYYTAKINQITSDYSDYKVTLVFPNDLSNAETMAKFKDKYKLTADMQLDPKHALVYRFGATVTPEVVVFNPNTQEVLYQGRIDDNYARVGQRKRVVQSDDLVNALEAIANETNIETSYTTPVGCYISKRTNE